MWSTLGFLMGLCWRGVPVRLNRDVYSLAWHVVFGHVYSEMSFNFVLKGEVFVVMLILIKFGKIGEVRAIFCFLLNQKETK